MNKYEIAARLAAHGVDDQIIGHFLVSAHNEGKSPLENFVSLTEKKIAGLKENALEVRPFEDVLREINGEKQTAEPDARYASGEQPMVGDEVVWCGIPMTLTKMPRSLSILAAFTLVRRAEVPK